MRRMATLSALIVLLLPLPCYPHGALDDPAPRQPDHQDKQANSAQHGIILGKLYFVRRNEKGEWVRRPDHVALESTKEAPKKVAEPKKKQESEKEAPKKEAGPTSVLDSRLLDIVLEAEEALKWQDEERAHMIAEIANEAAIWEFKVPAKLAKSDHVHVQLRYFFYATVRGFDGVAQVDITFLSRAKWKADRLEQYRKAKEGKSGKPMNREALAREFGIFELEAIQLDATGKQPYALSFPGGLLTNLNDDILEVRLQFRTKYVYASFYADDLVILDRP